MKELAETLELYVNKRTREIIIGCVALVERHDPVTMRADVQPLLRYTASGDTYAQRFKVLAGIPVAFLFAGGFYIRPEYKRGDLVWVSFATFDTTKGLKGQYDDMEGRAFSQESAVVQYGLAKTLFTAPAEFSRPGLIIGHEDGGMYCQFQSGKVSIKGTVEIDGDLKTTGKVDSGGEVTAMAETLPVKLSTHVHPYVDTPEGPGTTSPPTPEP